ncbi:hypothetical protein CPB83DRAFT_900064 [Crepidotus variabilis]|uniref:Uncharacterized protein n=1 Tax=Crepidotus variabilis TaxID=179855 RepID=A0A9P6E3T5_9AGAR|nr:hypothetical protein CPB83DRAFT_900064 [Crepidotus variabilis]
MPSRAARFTCFCAWCMKNSPLGQDGEPMGGSILEANRTAHRLRAQREMALRTPASGEVSNEQTDLSNAVLIETLTADYQNLKSSLPNTSTSAVLDSVLQGMQRLLVIGTGPSLSSAPLQNITNTPPNPTTSQFPETNVPIANNGPSHQQKPVAKREKSTHTKKAHKVLNGIEICAQSCLKRLGNLSVLSSPTELVDLETEYNLLHSTFNSVKQNVPSVDKRRKALRKMLLDVSTKLETSSGKR